MVLAGREEKAAQALAEDLQKQGIPALYAPSPEKPLKGKVLVVRGGLSAGAEFPEAESCIEFGEMTVPETGLDGKAKSVKSLPAGMFARFFLKK